MCCAKCSSVTVWVFSSKFSLWYVLSCALCNRNREKRHTPRRVGLGLGQSVVLCCVVWFIPEAEQGHRQDKTRQTRQTKTRADEEQGVRDARWSICDMLCLCAVCSSSVIVGWIQRLWLVEKDAAKQKRRATTGERTAFFCRFSLFFLSFFPG